MAERITGEMIEYVGILAKLALSEEEKAQAGRDMERMLGYIDLLNEVDTEGVDPMTHLFSVANVFREDVVTNGDGSEAVWAGAPGGVKEGGLKAPRTLE